MSSEIAAGLAASLRESVREPAVFSRIYESQAPVLLAFFVRRTFDVEAARDLMAETFLEAFAHRRRFRGQADADAQAWLYGMARHQLGRYTRTGIVYRKALERLGIDLPAVGEDDHQRILELAGLAELRAIVADAFSALSPAQREALQLRVIDEHAYPRVAAMLGVSEQTARARVSRGLRRIAELTDAPTLLEVNR